MVVVERVVGVLPVVRTMMWVFVQEIASEGGILGRRSRRPLRLQLLVLPAGRGPAYAAREGAARARRAAGRYELQPEVVTSRGQLAVNA